MIDRPWMAALDSQFSALRESRVQLALNPEPEYQMVLSAAMSALRLAQAYYWSLESAAAVRMAARSVPLDTYLDVGDLLDGGILHPRWYWFEGEPVYSHPLTMPGNPPSTHQVCALLLQPALLKPDLIKPNDQWPGPPAKEGYGLQFVIYGYSAIDSTRRLFPSGNWAWNFKEPLSVVLERAKATIYEVSPEAYGTSEALCRFVVAANAWLRQHYITAEAGTVERHRRKQLTREHALEAPVSDVKVIHLRRPESKPHQATGEYSVDWSCRWIVDGHWTHQVHGKGRSERRLQWIWPYPKGPADKPLRVPKATVYAVDR